MISITTLFESILVPDSTISDKNKPSWKKWIFPAAGLIGAGLAGGYLYSRYNQQAPMNKLIIPPTSSDVSNVKSTEDVLPKIQPLAVVKEPINIKDQQVIIPDRIKIRDASISNQQSDIVPLKIPKISIPENPRIEEKLPTTQITNNNVDRDDHEINNLVLNTLNL